MEGWFLEGWYACVKQVLEAAYLVVFEINSDRTRLILKLASLTTFIETIRYQLLISLIVFKTNPH